MKTKEMDIVEDRSPSDAKIHRLITSLEDPSIDIRHQSVRALGSIGKPAVEPLIQALKEAVDNDHRWYIALALSRIGVPAIDPLILAMRVYPEKEFRRFAAASLGTIGAPAIDPVINAMASDDRELRGFLSLALCRIGKPAVEPLTRRLDDADDRWVKRGFRLCWIR
jgi:HEAT repeat protein